MDIAHEIKKLKDRRTLIMALTYAIFFLPRFTQHKADPEMHYHIKQSLGLLIVFLALRGGIFLLMNIGLPFALIRLANLAWLAFVILGIYNVLQGRMRPLPYIGKYAERIF